MCKSSGRKIEVCRLFGRICSNQNVSVIQLLYHSRLAGANQYIHRRRVLSVGRLLITDITRLYNLPNCRWLNQWLMSPGAFSHNQVGSGDLNYVCFAWCEIHVFLVRYTCVVLHTTSLKMKNTNMYLGLSWLWGQVLPSQPTKVASLRQPRVQTIFYDHR